MIAVNTQHSHTVSINNTTTWSSVQSAQLSTAVYVPYSLLSSLYDTTCCTFDSLRVQSDLPLEWRAQQSVLLSREKSDQRMVAQCSVCSQQDGCQMGNHFGATCPTCLSCRSDPAEKIENHYQHLCLSGHFSGGFKRGRHHWNVKKTHFVKLTELWNNYVRTVGIKSVSGK